MNHIHSTVDNLRDAIFVNILFCQRFAGYYKWFPQGIRCNGKSTITQISHVRETHLILNNTKSTIIRYINNIISETVTRTVIMRDSRLKNNIFSKV